jgi:hypothetical protein
MTRRRGDVLALIFLVLLVTAFFARDIFTDRTLVTFRLCGLYPWVGEATQEEIAQPSVTSDCALSYYPRRVFATEMIRQGHVPFWNPHEFCGTPFLAAFQTAVFYPVNVFLYLFDPPTQMDLFLYLHFLLAAVFAYLLGRKLRLSVGASAISSIAFTFCGFMVTRYGQPTFVSTAGWLPALVFFGEHLLERPGLRRAGFLGLVIGLSILAGFPQLAMFNIYALVAYMAMRVGLEKGKRFSWRAGVMGLVGVSLGLAILVCAFQLLPTWELSTFSFRKMLPYSMVLSSAHHPLVSLKYLVPDILGHPLDVGVLSRELSRVGWGPVFQQNYVSTTGYVGVLPLLLAVVALTGLRRKAIPFVVLGAISLLAVFGTPLLHLFYRLLPGFNFSRIDRVIVIYMLSMAMLAGYGFDTARASGKRRWLAGAAFMAFALCFVAWFRTAGWREIYGYIGGAIGRDEYLAYASGHVYVFLGLALASGLAVMAAGARRLPGWLVTGAAIGVLLVDLIPNGERFKVSQPAESLVPRSRLVEYLKSDTGIWRFAQYGVDVIPSNTATILGFDDIHGYDALNVNRYIEVLGAVDSTVTSVGNAALRRRIGPITSREALASPLLDMLNVKYILTVAETGGPRPQAVSLVNEGYLPRAYLVPHARFFADYDSVLAFMRSGRFDPRGEVLLVGPPDTCACDSLTGPPGAAVIAEHSPERVDIDADVDRHCYLFVSDVDYPGWRAYLDGTEVELLRANYAFRAVELNPGSHLVRMEYVPLYFRIGLLFSITGWGLVGLVMSSRRRLQ